MNGSQPQKDERDRSGSRWVPPSDSDLIGLPLFLGMGAAALVITAAFVFIGGLAGLLALIVVLVLALAISYRVVTASDPED
jgi:hypothetical protein